MLLSRQVFVWLGECFWQLLFSWSFWLIVLITGITKYRLTRDSVQAGSLTLFAVLAGMLGGLLGSLLMITVGITVDTRILGPLLAVALLLMLIRPRFICFSYAGGLLSLSYLIFGWPVVDVPQLMGLVAVLHWIEAILIVLTGYRDAYPKMIKKEKASGRWHWGYEMNKLWPLPLVALMVFYASPELLENSFRDMPAWWPLIPVNEDLIRESTEQGLLAMGGELHYSLVPVVAVLGYQDVAVGMTPRQKAKRTALGLLLFSFALLALCWLAAHYRGQHEALAFIPAIFAPLAHEALMEGTVPHVRNPHVRNRPFI